MAMVPILLVWAVHGLQLSSGQSHLLQLGVLHRLPGGYPVWSVSPWVAEGQCVPPWSSSWPAEESVPVPRVALPLLFHWPWCQCTELFLLQFSYSSFLQPLCNISYLFLSFQRNARASSLLFGTAVSCSGSILELAGTSCFWHVGSNFQGKNVHVSTLASCLQNCHLIQLLCMFLNTVYTWISLGQTEAQSESTPVSLQRSKFLFAVVWKKQIHSWYYTILSVILFLMVCKYSVVKIVCRHCLPHVK